MGIILKHSLPYLPYIIYVFLSFWVSIYHFFFSIFQNALKLVQKRMPWKKSHKMFKTDISLQYSQTYMWISISKHSTWAHRRHFVLCIHFSSFVFRAFPMPVSKSPSSSESALLCTSESLSCFSIFVLYFSSMSVFLPLYDLHVVRKKHTNYSRNI